MKIILAHRDSNVFAESVNVDFKILGTRKEPFVSTTLVEHSERITHLFGLK